MTTLDRQREFYAQEIQAVANLRSSSLVAALARVPRERFLPPGPWTFRNESDPLGGPKTTPDDQPHRVYHNVSVAIDPSRSLFNGAPGVLAPAIDALDVRPGGRVLHIGAGTGYYTAVLAECAGPDGHVVGVEVDAALAEMAKRNLADWPSVRVEHGDGSTVDSIFDAILVNAGVTHPLTSWLDAVGPSGRMVLPLTATFPGMAHIGKGVMLSIARTDRPDQFSATVLSFVAVYSAVSIRDDAINAQLAQTLGKYPMPPIRRLRLDAHDHTGTCWLHGAAMCWSMAGA